MLNHITVMGRLTKDPELRRTATGTAVTSFTIACDRDFGENGQKETDFLDCVAWRGTAEFVERNFSKGRMIVVSGRLQIRSWTDKDGNKRRSAEVVADSVYFGDSKKSEQGNNSTYQAQNPYPGSTGDFSDTMAYIANMQAQQSDFTMLDGDDAQMPF